MVPAFRRAYNQLKMKVRALPTCKKPVGEGAKRTRGPELDKSSFLMGIEEFDMGRLMVRSGRKQRQAGTALPFQKAAESRESLLSTPPVLKSY
jgi:hypothetical protein